MTQDRRAASPALSISDSELLEGLEEPDGGLDMVGWREREFQQMQHQARVKRELLENGRGVYTGIKDEKELLQLTIKEKLCVVHFYHTDFTRCAIMDSHLSILAESYFETRFLKANVADVPWLVSKLGIKVLPCVILFKNGITCGRIVGFEEFGNSDKFPTRLLEARLRDAGVLTSTGPDMTDGKKSDRRGESSRAAVGKIRQGALGHSDDSDFDM